MIPGTRCGSPRPGSTNSRVPELQVPPKPDNLPSGAWGTTAGQVAPYLAPDTPSAPVGIVIANAVAFCPRRATARLSPAEVLRAE